MRDAFVYIMANRSRRTYVGVTSNLERRVWEHKHKVHECFTKRYNIVLLVYMEQLPDMRDAIAREKELKDWRRDRKVALIQAANPEWLDLAQGWWT